MEEYLLIHYNIKNRTIELTYDTGADYQALMAMIRLIETLQEKEEVKQ